MDRPARRRFPAFILLVLVLVALASVQFLLLREDEEPASKISWRTDFQAALREAGVQSKPVLLNFTASWCPPCQEMKRITWPDERIQNVLRARMVPVRLDMDDPANARLAVMYGVTTIPTLIVVDAWGRPVRQGGFMTADDLLAFVCPPVCDKT